MRSDRSFLAKYRAATAAADPGSERLGAAALRTVGLVELCLRFLDEHLPDERTDAVPAILLGYPSVLDTLAAPGVAHRRLPGLRHLCSRFSSVASWLDAVRRHAEVPQTIRCYDVVGSRVVRRRTASAAILRSLDESLDAEVPWVVRSVRPAEPGEHHVRTNHGDTVLSYTVPAPRAAVLPPPRHRKARRAINPPVVLAKRDMIKVAEEIDRAEAQRGWPSSLEPLHLAGRLRKVEAHDPDGRLWRDDSLVLDGATHLVGMLSSGKSSLVWGILFALTKGGGGRRVAVLATDTIQAAAMVARLQGHGVAATVLSSPYNREGHLNSIHWQQSLADGGVLVTSAGDLTSNFGVACPLDGSQREPKVVRGRRGDIWFPGFREKPCHRLQPLDAEAGDEVEDDELPGTSKRSCPLWARCPAQVQQRSAVDAQVVVMTPAAFVHMTPDPWVSEDLMTMPELLQFAFDVVLIDEVDGFQKTLDGFFAPRETLMGDERTVYAPSIAVRSSEALRVRSGAQFRHEVNTRWQKRFHDFFGLIGSIYSILQNERAHLVGTVSEVPFTAGSILYDLWSRGVAAEGGDLAAEREGGFLNVTRTAAALARSSRLAVAGRQDEEAEADDPTEPGFKAATDTLRDVAAKVALEDYYDDALSLIEASLDGSLGVFDARARDGMPTAAKRRVLEGRANAAAILLAVVTDMVLQHYGWLARTQPAVATDFGIDDTQLLSHANNLIRHYRTLLPANPAGAVFGLSYDFPEGDGGKGGKLTLVNHLGVGRHLVTHLHDLLAAEGQAGPHVLMLSGTSWAGGRIRRTIGGRTEAVASPVFDVQVPVKGVLVQPASETDAIGRSIFRLVSCPDERGVQARASGLDEPNRRKSLKSMAQVLARRRGEVNQIEEHWARAASTWGEGDIADRRRALFVTNSYADAAVVADTLAETLGRDWGVRCLVRDRGDDDEGGRIGPRLAAPLPRSLVERFGALGERSVLVAPLQVVSRGHNILNEAGRAAISAIYFLHRPHPRPDDMSAVIGRLNRFAVERHDQGLSRVSRSESAGDAEDETVPARMRRLRHAASRIVREGMDRRGGYSGLPPHYKSQFAWDLLTPLWQTVGRGIRNGCPVFVGFVDRQFAPHSFDLGDEPDTGASSVLIQIVEELRLAMKDPVEGDIAHRLYAPFLGALARTQGLNGVRDDQG